MTADLSIPLRLGLCLIERSTRSECETVEINVSNIDAFAIALDIDPSSISVCARFELDTPDIDWLNKTFGLRIDFELFHVFLTPIERNIIPYILHTGRELRMMLEGTKPLAIFSDFHPSPHDPWVFPEDVFAPHVRSGLLVQREYCELLDQVPNESVKGSRVLLYARAVEAWRIDAYITMRFASEKSGWNEGFERMVGALLGYEAWQTEDHLRRNGAWWERMRSERD